MKNSLIIIALLLSGVAVFFSWMNYKGRPRIAVVRTGEVMAQYVPMREASSLYDMRVKSLSDDSTSSNREKEELVGKANDEHRKLTAGIVNQFNTYVEKYAKDEGYDVVLGATLSGNILYAKDAIDITPQLIEGLNDTYKSK